LIADAAASPRDRGDRADGRSNLAARVFFIFDKAPPHAA